MGEARRCSPVMSSAQCMLFVLMWPGVEIPRGPSSAPRRVSIRGFGPFSADPSWGAHCWLLRAQFPNWRCYRCLSSGNPRLGHPGARSLVQPCLPAVHPDSPGTILVLISPWPILTAFGMIGYSRSVMLRSVFSAGGCVGGVTPSHSLGRGGAFKIGCRR